MPNVPFSGTAVPLQPHDVDTVAKILGIDSPAVDAVLLVETGGAGGFLPDGRPRILFEATVFHTQTAGAFDAAHPLISSAVPNWHLYQGGPAEYDRLNEAIGLNRQAALMSASWGLFQIMGENFASCGYADVESYVTAMEVSELLQLQAFSTFITKTGLLAALRAHDWDAFARGYNGPAYRQNNYAEKLARAWAMSRPSAPVPIQMPPLLQVGSRGPLVEAVQRALIAGGAQISVDGFYGRMTELAVMAAQSAAHLATDGVVGPKTAAALNVELS